uniref:Uncharacterized protein n=1 Tax=Oryza rufipogon TaxID=4529 RepID=A0A0E0N9N0_ORYRU
MTTAARTSATVLSRRLPSNPTPGRRRRRHLPLRHGAPPTTGRCRSIGGLAEYVPEHGLSPASDGSGMVLSLPRTLTPASRRCGRSLLPRDYTLPGALNPVGSDLVGRFLHRQTDDEHRDGPELFVVFTAVEVELCDDDDGDAQVQHRVGGKP